MDALKKVTDIARGLKEDVDTVVHKIKVVKLRKRTERALQEYHALTMPLAPQVVDASLDKYRIQNRMTSAVESMQEFAAELEYADRVATMERIKEFTISAFQSGHTSANNVISIIDHSLSRLDMADSGKDMFLDFMLKFGVNQHAAGNLKTSDATDGIGNILGSKKCEWEPLKKYGRELLAEHFFRTVLPWVKKLAVRDVSDIPEGRETAENLRNIFLNASSKSALLPLQTMHILSNGIYEDESFIVAPYLRKDHNFTECCVVFKNAAGSNGYPLVACEHGVLDAFDMIRLSSLHKDLRGTRAGQEHATLLHKFVKPRIGIS